MYKNIYAEMSVRGVRLFSLVNNNFKLLEDNKGDNGMWAETQECWKPAFEQRHRSFSLDNMEEHFRG